MDGIKILLKRNDAHAEFCLLEVSLLDLDSTPFNRGSNELYGW